MVPDPKLSWDVVAVPKDTPLTLHSVSGYCAPQIAAPSAYSFVCLSGGWGPGWCARAVGAAGRSSRRALLARSCAPLPRPHSLPSRQPSRSRQPSPPTFPVRAASRDAVNSFASDKCSALKADVSAKYAGMCLDGLNDGGLSVAALIDTTEDAAGSPLPDAGKVRGPAPPPLPRSPHFCS
jgi:hypothetical protein